MTNSNRIKLTWISFFSYALTGALVIVTGMVMGNIADYFHLPVSSMSNTFTFLNAGILISIFLNAWLMEIVPLKTQLRFGFNFDGAGGDRPDAQPQPGAVLRVNVRSWPGERDHHVDRDLPDHPYV